MRRGIVCAGTVVLDINNQINAWPEEEQIAFIQASVPAPGGPPHNAAAGLVKLGAPFPVEMIAVVGDDDYGQVFVDKAAELGLDVSQVMRRANINTDHTFVMTSAKTGKRTFFYRPGANNTLEASQLLPPDDTARIYYLGSPGISTSMDSSDGWRSVLKEVRIRGFKTCMELCPVPAETQRKFTTPCLPLLDYFVINDSEAEIVGGLPVLKDGTFDFALAEAAARNLLALGVNEVAAIHHPSGAVAVRSSGEVARAPSVNVPQAEIVSSVGAGDAFYAGMLFGLHDDWPLADCLALANAAAATSLHAATTATSIRPYTECLAYAKSRGLRPTSES